MKLVYGIGTLGNGLYNSGSGKRGRHNPCYKVWSHMLGRCYNTKDHAYPQYGGAGVYVDIRWHDFQNFAEFYYGCKYRENNYKLDKDILVKGNKIYGPDFCCFVPVEINNLFVLGKSFRGELPIGVIGRKNKTKSDSYTARCNDGSGKGVYLGVHSTIQEAFCTYVRYKESLIKARAEEFKSRISPNVYSALLGWKIAIDV